MSTFLSGYHSLTTSFECISKQCAFTALLMAKVKTHLFAFSWSQRWIDSISWA